MKTTQMNDIRLINADLYRLIANCFDYPDKERLLNIKEMATGLHHTGYPDDSINNMLQSLAEAVKEDEILYAFTNIFVKGGVPLSETHLLQKYNSVSDANAFYKAFGFAPKTGENPDSIMYQLEFLALLLVKSAIAPTEESRSITEDAYHKFLEEHTGEFALALAKRLREGDAGPFFLTVSYLLEEFITNELTGNNTPPSCNIH